ncbi:MAG: hypothetical protein ABUL67_03930 [Haliangium ochraceum]
MNFGGWISLDEAPAAAPDAPGLWQARADALLAYPRGKSAMVMYARSRPDETLRRYVAGRGVAALGHAAACGARWLRFGASASPDADFDRLLRRFVDRFGAPPAANSDSDMGARFTDG